MSRTPAQVWGAALQRAMDRRGVTQTALAAEALVSQDGIRRWRYGRVLPSIDSAARMAEALMDDRLLRLAIEARTRTCIECDRTFVMPHQNGPRFGRWCSDRCRQRKHESRQRATEARGRRRSEREERNGRELAFYRDRVARYCGECEPAGVCLVADCALRDVSPLPLVARRAA